MKIDLFKIATVAVMVVIGGVTVYNAASIKELESEMAHARICAYLGNLMDKLTNERLKKLESKNEES